MEVFDVKLVRTQMRAIEPGDIFYVHGNEARFMLASYVNEFSTHYFYMRDGAGEEVFSDMKPNEAPVRKEEWAWV